MATPAQIANDMSAHATYWQGRDKRTACACRDAAVMIRSYLNGANVDGRAYSGLFGRLLDLETRYRGEHYAGIGPALTRARLALAELKKETCA